MKRGPYRKYNKDVNVPVPKVSDWRKRKEIEEEFIDFSMNIEEGMQLAQNHKTTCTLLKTTLYILTRCLSVMRLNYAVYYFNFIS